MSTCKQIVVCKVVKWASPWSQSASIEWFHFKYYFLTMSTASKKYEWIGKWFDNNYSESLFIFRQFLHHSFLSLSLVFIIQILCKMKWSVLFVWFVFYLRFIVNCFEIWFNTKKVEHLLYSCIVVSTKCELNRKWSCWNLYQWIQTTQTIIARCGTYEKQKIHKLILNKN